MKMTDRFRLEMHIKKGGESGKGVPRPLCVRPEADFTSTAKHSCLSAHGSLTSSLKLPNMVEIQGFGPWKSNKDVDEAKRQRRMTF